MYYVSAEICLLPFEFRCVPENSQWENTKVQAQGTCYSVVEEEAIEQV